MKSVPWIRKGGVYPLHFNLLDTDNVTRETARINLRTCQFCWPRIHPGGWKWGIKS